MYIPPDGAFNKPGDDAPELLMRALNGNYGQTSEDGTAYTCYWDQYYWLVFVKRDIQEPEIQVFYEKNFKPIKFDELKKLIEDTLKPK